MRKGTALESKSVSTLWSWGEGVSLVFLLGNGSACSMDIQAAFLPLLRASLS